MPPIRALLSSGGSAEPSGVPATDIGVDGLVVDGTVGDDDDHDDDVATFIVVDDANGVEDNDDDDSGVVTDEHATALHWQTVIGFAEQSCSERLTSTIGNAQSFDSPNS
jgi:hypothetical protein